MIELHIVQQGTKFKVLPIELPELTAGYKSEHDLKIFNDTNYEISELKLVPNSNLCEITHPKVVKAQSQTLGSMSLSCPEDIDSDVLDITLSVSGVGRRR